MSDLPERMELIGAIGHEINRLSKSLKEANRIILEYNEIHRLNDRIKRLEQAGDALKAAGYFGGFNDAVDKWNKAKEAKP